FPLPQASVNRLALRLYEAIYPEKRLAFPERHSHLLFGERNVSIESPCCFLLQLDPSCSLKRNIGEAEDHYEYGYSHGWGLRRPSQLPTLPSELHSSAQSLRAPRAWRRSQLRERTRLGRPLPRTNLPTVSHWPDSVRVKLAPRSRNYRTAISCLFRQN